MPSFIEIQDLSRVTQRLPPVTEKEEQADERSCAGRSEEFAPRRGSGIEPTLGKLCDIYIYICYCP